MSTMETKSPWLTVRESARRLGVHENTIRRWADRGLVESVKLPTGVRRLLARDVDRLARGAETRSADPAEPLDGHPRTIDELAAEQGVKPISDVAELAVPDLWDSDEEVEEFIALTYAERDADR